MRDYYESTGAQSAVFAANLSCREKTRDAILAEWFLIIGRTESVARIVICLSPCATAPVFGQAVFFPTTESEATASPKTPKQWHKTQMGFAAVFVPLAGPSSVKQRSSRRQKTKTLLLRRLRGSGTNAN